MFPEQGRRDLYISFSILYHRFDKGENLKKCILAPVSLLCLFASIGLADGYTPGTYTGVGAGRNGDITISITVNETAIEKIDVLCSRVKHRLQQAPREQSRERWRFAKQIQLDLDCDKKEAQWEKAVRQALPNGLDCSASRCACPCWLYHITSAYFANTWLGDCIPRHVMMWSSDCRWYTASCFLPSSRLYIRIRR